MIKIAILGATGQIGKALSNSLLFRPNFRVSLYVRSLTKANDFVQKIGGGKFFDIHQVDKFGSQEYQVVVNCIGFGNPSSLRAAGENIFRVTEKFDNLVLDYLRKYPETIYINLSSGAVYGKSFKKPAEKNAKALIEINGMTIEDSYAITKINSEAKHRHLADFNIVDLRIFSFFSRFIEIDSGFLISDLIKKIRENEVFEASPQNIVRDYVGPDDLLDLILLTIKKGVINDSFDVYSTAPISKIKLLDFLKNKYRLKYRVVTSVKSISPSGSKIAYYSKDRKAHEVLGYQPKHSSLANIKEEIKHLL